MSDKVKLRADFRELVNSHIAYGQVDGTSTSTVFTATVPNVNSLVDGTTVMLRNGIVSSATGFTLNVNNLGAKPVYSSMHDATADTTVFNINYTMLFVYDTTRVSGGCWICYRGYNTNDNTLGYQIRTNSQRMYATDKTYLYRILLEVDDTHYMPVNTSTSTSADVSKTSTMNSREFRLGGKIIYYGYTSAINANAQFGAGYHWIQYPFNLGYSFNNTNSALALTQWSPVYMVAQESSTNKGMAKLVSPYYTQTLPSTEDGKLYIYLGQAYSTTNIELLLEHPIYEYKDGKIRLYHDCYTIAETNTLLNGKANTTHNHTKSQITDFPTLSTVATSGSYNDLSDKPNIPEGSTVDTVLSSTSNNAIANSTVKNALDGKANTNHTHNNYVNPTIVNDLTTGGTTSVLSAEQGKTLNNTKLDENQTITLISNILQHMITYNSTYETYDLTYNPSM